MRTKSPNFKSFLIIVKEFIRALGKARTYDITKNPYLIFGVLWGIPVPLVTIGIGLFYKGLSFSFSNIFSEFLTNPIQFFFFVHPVLFGMVFGAMGTIRDDKEKQKLAYQSNLVAANKELKAKNKRLQELDELKDNFLSMVSHELLSPLTTVEGYVSFMKQGKTGIISDQQEEMLEVIESQIEHLNGLIEDLIDISKLEAGKFQVKLERLNVNEVVDQVARSVGQSVDEKKIRLECKLSAEVTHVLADKKRIIQVLTNILTNAIKFTSPKGRVTIHTRENDGMAEFAIIDTGLGIPLAEQDKIFDKFYQVDSTSRRKHGGCGLGLAITKHIIDLHRGRIWVESEVGRGSTFFFQIQKYSELGSVNIQGGNKSCFEYII